MREILTSFLVLSIGAILSIPSVSAAHPYDEATKGKDSIEWVALWKFPKTREEQLERMLSTELQRKTLFALQEKQYLKLGKENVHSIDPFQVANMRTVDGGFYVLNVIASVHNNNEVDKKVEKYQITFRHNFDLGFVVMNVVKK
ncbi:hypothetical protein [Paenibacillus illinoisensis]|uniref:Uncharacterized protein n=1 Tax=Paenibacillus illinoisensis TaxID=59845 RepID=A0A2W0C2I5_9BACL|nr:hypothetical protein [Paenibacillus illinoisensis]PYY25954.1 Uncharacterized protein PIL02S_05324 [Paenibacillus illinoisensis]